VTVRRLATHASTAAVAILVLAIAAALLGGCGGGSSTPSYCSKVADLKSAVKQLGNVDVIQGGTNSLTSAVQKVATTGKSAIAAAKTDFSSETGAVKSSLTALENSVRQLSSSQAKTALTQIPGEVAAVGAAANELVSATTSKC
jgi:DUF917 family protein